MKILNILTLTVVAISMLIMSTAFAYQQQVGFGTNFIYEVENEDSLLAAVKYDEIVTCEYFMYDEESGEYYHDNPLPSVTLEEAIVRLKKLSTLDGSFIGFEPPNKKTVQFSYVDGVGLTMGVLNVNSNGYYEKIVTIDEAIEILEIIYFGRDFSKIEGIVFETW
jgi:hypothetical protein